MAQDAQTFAENQYPAALQNSKSIKNEISELTNTNQNVSNCWQEEEKRRLVAEEKNRQLQQKIMDFERNYKQQIATLFEQHEHQKQEWQIQQVQIQQSTDAKIQESERQLKKQEQLYRDAVETMKLQNQGVACCRELPLRA